MKERSGQIVAFAVAMMLLVAVVFAGMTAEEPHIEWKRRCIQTDVFMTLTPQVREEFYCIKYEWVCQQMGDVVACPEGQP